MNTAIAAPELSLSVAYNDPSFHDYLRVMKDVFLLKTGDDGIPLFTTDAEGLFDAYLDAFPADARQYHNCHACRRFIETYGALVTIDSRGNTSSAIWDVADVPPAYQPSVQAMLVRISCANVRGVFLSRETVWGSPITGDWEHFAIVPLKSMVFRSRLLTAGQAMAEKKEDFKNVVRALSEFNKDNLAVAVSILSSDALYRSEKVLGPAQWLLDLQTSRDLAKNTKIKANLAWLAIATAPAGFCHPRSSMIGTLLEDIAAGLDFTQVSKKFADKMKADKYLRPQSAPNAGNIEQAEKIIAQLGVASSLPRRFARLDEIPTIWKPEQKQAEDNGTVFGHLKQNGKSKLVPLAIPQIRMSWEKFERTALANAKKMRLFAPAVGNYTALVTAVNPESPPILTWDHEGTRNNFSWYGYVGGSNSERWNVAQNRWAEITGISRRPHEWQGHYPQFGKGIFLIIDGAKDFHSRSGALFPELLKNEFHSIRKTIEAYSANATLTGLEEASACGISLSAVATHSLELEVTNDVGIVSKYLIDRWD